MTADERKQQRGQILADLEEAEDALGALQVKATRIANVLSAVSHKLKYNATLEPKPEDFDMNFELENRLTPQNQGELADVTYGNLIKLIEELKVARQKVFNLRQQRDMTR